MTAAFTAAFTPPAIYALPQDVAPLRALAERAGGHEPGASLFRQEVHRLSVVEIDRPDFVRLGTCVRYRDLRSKWERVVRVTRPGEMEPDTNDVSVLSPIGAALIGLRAGAIFRWTDADGRPRAIKVLSIDAEGRMR